MAYKIGNSTNEVWVNEQGSMIAAKTTTGKWVYYTATNTLSVNGQMLENHPVVAREISGMNLEIIDAKKKS